MSISEKLKVKEKFLSQTITPTVIGRSKVSMATELKRELPCVDPFLIDITRTDRANAEIIANAIHIQLPKLSL